MIGVFLCVVLTYSTRYVYVQDESNDDATCSRAHVEPEI